MVEAIRKLREVLDTYPECLRAQQHHQAVTVPAAHAAAEETVVEALGKEERTLLRDVLDAIDGNPLQEVDD